MDSAPGSVKSLSSLRNFRKPSSLSTPSPTSSENSNPPFGTKRNIPGMSSTDSDDCVIQRNPKKRRVIVSSDEEGEGTTQAPEVKEPSGDEIDAMLDELKKAFPDKPELELQDALKDADWIVQAAISELKPGSPAMNGHSKEKKKKKQKRVKKNFDSDSSDDERGKRKKGGDFKSDDDEEGYHFDGGRVYDSDESDEESLMETTKERTQVVDFLQNATREELTCMQSSSTKRADLIMGLRPYTSWSDVVAKFRAQKSLNLDVLNAAKDALKIQRDVARLLNRCEKISKSLEIAVGKLMNQGEKAADGNLEAFDLVGQPEAIPEHLRLTHYQILGLNWLNLMKKNKLNGVLADEMGLGKTIQVIAFLALLDEQGNPGPHLIIVPSSTLDNWIREFGVWCPSLQVISYTGSQAERKQIRIAMNGILENKVEDPMPHVFLTTYNIATSTTEDKTFTKKMPFGYVIFDEAHMLKNCFTQRYENLMKIQAKRRILLTGTPMQNSLKELMALLMFVMPKMFASYKTQLLATFSLYRKDADSDDNENLNMRSKFEREKISQASRIMQPFFLRRLKRNVLRDLPPKTEEVFRVALHPEQKKLYDDLLRNIREKVAAAKESGPSLLGGGASIMMQLRKMANHPLLLRNKYDDEKLKKLTKLLMKEPANANSLFKYVMEELQHMSDYEIHHTLKLYPNLRKYALSDEEICACGKMLKMDELLPGMLERGDKVLVFSQFVIVLDIVETYMKIRGYKFVRFDGSTAREERQILMDKFNNDPNIFIFLLTTKAGGQGINLIGGNTVILHDIDFNPHNDKQAEDRCHRVGQTRPVKVIRLIGEGTIEESMYRMAQEKLKLEEDLGCSATAAEEDSTEVKTNTKDVFRLLHDYLKLDMPDVIPNGGEEATPTKKGAKKVDSRVKQ